MKKEFFELIIQEMEKNKDIYFISCGLGWPHINKLHEKFPDRFIQVEASEQTALDMAVGLAYDGKIPVVYTITPFFWRAAETIRTYLDHENLHVILVGAGREDDYSKEDGFSHFAGDDKDLFQCFKNIYCHWPEDSKRLPGLLSDIIKDRHPHYLNIKK